MQNNKNERTQLLLNAVENCTNLSELYSLVQNESIDVRMRSLSTASSVTRQKLLQSDELTPEAYLENIKKAVKEAIEQNG